MEKWNLNWKDECICGVEEIDSAHKFIIEKAALLHEKLEKNHFDEDEMINLGTQISSKILQHMIYEIELMKKLKIKDWEKHQANHELYKKNTTLSKITL